MGQAGFEEGLESPQSPHSLEHLRRSIVTGYDLSNRPSAKADSMVYITASARATPLVSTPSIRGLEHEVFSE
jgi:hypothetical protein